MKKVFEGKNVFMSRNLVPPELFDALHDALKLNDANVFLCCDPCRNAPNDFHVISSPDHEKFEDLQSKGCNLLGPQCVILCAKEQRLLPKQGFTCCLAMDGVKVLASGFEMDEKAEIGKLVSAMGGVLLSRASVDVSFVIVKNVLAAKYKWALYTAKKPIVTMKWLHHCWKEHHLVSQESYRVLPFSGLTICVSRVPADERKEMEKIIIQNGGKYSAELTRKCTHLICDAPEGDKYKVARRWGHIHIITKKWFDQSIARRACLSEEAFPVQASPLSSMNTTRLISQPSQYKGTENPRCFLSSMETSSNSEAVVCARIMDSDIEVTGSHGIPPSFSDAPVSTSETEMNKQPTELREHATSYEGCVANDSQNEDSDLYLSDCRILLVGFNATEMRKLVNMIRNGGGSRYMYFNDKLTHMVVGTPSETEIKEVRHLAALGMIHVVRTAWLEECDCRKIEVPVLPRHIAYNLLHPEDPIFSVKRSTANMDGSAVAFKERTKEEVALNRESSCREPDRRFDQHTVCPSSAKGKIKMVGTCNGIEGIKSSSVFKGKKFRFSCSFPADQRAEIVEWINQGGGEMLNDHVDRDAHFTVERHGAAPSESDATMSTYVSSHWIRCCLEDGLLLDVHSHILYSPLPCQIPIPGFDTLQLCVSQYDEKERLLLKNLCFILGVKLVEKLTKRATHLLCKFTDGPKYEAACKWGIIPVTSEWINRCVKESKVVAPDPFYPKEVTSQDRKSGLCTMSQYPTQAVQMISGGNPSQLLSQSQQPINMKSEALSNKIDTREEEKHSSMYRKKGRLSLEAKEPQLVLGTSLNEQINMMNSTKNNISDCTREIPPAVPDVAAAIEDLLEQTTRINDQKSPVGSACDKHLFTSDCSVLDQDHDDPQTALALPKHWMNRFDKNEELCNPRGDVNVGVYDGFSETQTESQVVGYAEDLSGRQMIIDRVRIRSGASMN